MLSIEKTIEDCKIIMRDLTSVVSDLVGEVGLLGDHKRYFTFYSLKDRINEIDDKISNMGEIVDNSDK